MAGHSSQQAPVNCIDMSHHTVSSVWQGRKQTHVLTGEKLDKSLEKAELVSLGRDCMTCSTSSRRRKEWNGLRDVHTHGCKHTTTTLQHNILYNGCRFPWGAPGQTRPLVNCNVDGLGSSDDTAEHTGHRVALPVHTQCTTHTFTWPVHMHKDGYVHTLDHTAPLSQGARSSCSKRNTQVIKDNSDDTFQRVE